VPDGSDISKPFDLRKFGGLKRQRQGTPQLEVDDPKFICPFCTNTGWAERTAKASGPRWKHCPCKQEQVSP
jgi:hypothetical protein